MWLKDAPNALTTEPQPDVSDETVNKRVRGKYGL
jgi:hypothetical protein